jgi:hypothetical protein
MTTPWRDSPHPPQGYYLFASHEENGWEMWVPPDTSQAADRLRAFQFRNRGADKVVMNGPPPCVSVGHAVSSDGEVYTSDVTNDYNGRDSGIPRIPAFIALWCAYVVSIAGQLDCRTIQIGNVANQFLRDMLTALGFEEDAPTYYIGTCTRVGPGAVSRAGDAGWTFPRRQQGQL